MAHHGNNNDFLKDYQNDELWKSLKLGATGKFPEGKITNDDEGELKFGITTTNGKVIVDFGKSIAWVGLTKEQAKQLGEILITRSNEI